MQVPKVSNHQVVIINADYKWRNQGTGYFFYFAQKNAFHNLKIIFHVYSKSRLFYPFTEGDINTISIELD